MHKVTIGHLDVHLRALLRHSPYTAARNGVLGLVLDALVQGDHTAEIDQLSEAAKPLADVLDVGSLYEISDGLHAVTGKPPTAVSRALAAPPMVDALCYALDALECYELGLLVERWGPRRDNGAQVAPALLNEARVARWDLVSRLLARAGALYAGWREQGVMFGINKIHIDGRTMSAAARAWQVPMITGVIPELPTASAVMHPNRLGRTAATVAYARLPEVVNSPAPDAAVFEPIALLVAVAEAISGGVDGTRLSEQSDLGAVVWDSAAVERAKRGQVRVRVRDVDEPVSPESADLATWWPVFTSWGATSRLVQAVPTAWRLSDVEADVLVWALCSAAVRIAIAASMPRSHGRRAIGAAEELDWPAFYRGELPRWDAGAQSVWRLMQTPRRFALRTPWPGSFTLAPKLHAPASWPWCPPE